MKIIINGPGDWVLNHYIFIWSGVINGWYQQHKFIVLDRLPDNKNVTNVVYFPDLPDIFNQKVLTKIRPLDGGLSRGVSKVHIDLHKKVLPPENYKFFKEKLESTKQFKYKKDILDEYISDIKSIINVEIPFDSIEVFTSYFGTRGSYFYQSDQRSVQMVFRGDQSMDGIIKLILRLIIQNNYQYKQNSMSWESVEYVVYHYLTQTKLSKYLQMFPHEPLIAKLTDNRQDMDLIHESNEYLRRLGVMEIANVSLDGDHIIINDQKLIPHGNKGKLLRLLIKNKSTLCSFDDITKELYGGVYETDKFSIQYITKLIEETRRYLLAKGIPKNLIITVRGEGYIIP